MPGFNGTGPVGEGPRTGWGTGACDANGNYDLQKNFPFLGRCRNFLSEFGRGFLRGRRFGRGRGRGMGRGRGFGRGLWKQRLMNEDLDSKENKDA